MSPRRPRDGEPTAPWCVGAARFIVEPIVSGSTLVVAARCRIGQGGSELQALLDTGALWSMVGGELAEALEPEGEDESFRVTLSTRFGNIEGHLHRLGVTLVADEGDDLHVSSSLLLARTWPGPPVLGYRGFLERIRIGLDPGEDMGEQWLFFGSSS